MLRWCRTKSQKQGHYKTEAKVRWNKMSKGLNSCASFVQITTIQKLYENCHMKYTVIAIANILLALKKW